MKLLAILSLFLASCTGRCMITSGTCNIYSQAHIDWALNMPDWSVAMNREQVCAAWNVRDMVAGTNHCIIEWRN